MPDPLADCLSQLLIRPARPLSLQHNRGSIRQLAPHIVNGLAGLEQQGHRGRTSLWIPRGLDTTPFEAVDGEVGRNATAVQTPALIRLATG